MNKRILLGAMLTGLMIGTSFASDEMIPVLQPKFGQLGDKVLQVTPVEQVKGIYEVLVQGQGGRKEIRYSTADGNYIFAGGQLLDIAGKRAITQDRLQELTKIDFKKDLPLDKALVEKKGDGSMKIAMIEDPNCGYCKKFRQEVLSKLDNITIYNFPVTFLGDRSAKVNSNILCSKDPAKAWAEWFDKGVEPKSDPSCYKGTDEYIALARKLGVNGTPAYIFEDGVIRTGASNLESVKQSLAAIYGKDKLAKK